MRNRCKLHLTKIEDFVDFVSELGYKREPTKGFYEVLRIRRDQDEPPVLFFTRVGTDHATVYGKGMSLVDKYLRTKRRGNVHVSMWR